MRMILKYLSFGTLGVVLLMLVFATVFEKFYGTDVVVQYVYTSPWVVAVWALLALSAFSYTIVCRLYKLLVTFGLHISLLVILAGALVTHISGMQGRVHMRVNDVALTAFVLADGGVERFPFAVSLQDFRLEYYQGTFAPMDYVSIIGIEDDADRIVGEVSMNNIFSYRGYRFYQSGYDADGKGVTLAISYDPCGIAVTYTGYLLLLVSMIGFFFVRATAFRLLLRRLSVGRGVALGALLLISADVCAGDVPRTLPRDVAGHFGDMYVYYNDRICPLQTLAKDFTVKLCGRSSYKGLTPEQVLMGWFFYYDEWKQEPMIKIKEKAVRNVLGIDGAFAALADFTSVNGYKLDDALQNSGNHSLRRAASAANEKFNLVSMVCTGSLLKLYPYRTDDSTPVWYSLADRLPSDMPDEQWAFVRNSMNYIAEKVAMKNFDEVVALVGKIRTYQQKEAGTALPSDLRFEAEKLYNEANYIRVLAMLCVSLGLVCFVVYCRRMVADVPRRPLIHGFMLFLLASLFVYLSFFMILRGYVSGHLPLSNGFETMVFMAWCSLLITLVAQRIFFMAVPFGLLLCGLTLLVAMMGDANPQITQLMPVLQSPLLSVHVAVIMVAYSLQAFAMLNGVTALVLRHSKGGGRKVEYLADVSRVMLYPAVFLLAVGIFVGAVWANVSWGRYWGWDPKEVWALITLLVYSLALHSGSLPCFRRPMFMHLFCIFAFLTVLITYFGVNFVLGGMHAYA